MHKYVKILRYLSLFLIAVSVIVYTVIPHYGAAILILFATGVIILVACAVFSYKQAGEEGTKRAARSGMEASLSVMLLALILVLAQVFSVRNNLKLDTTQNRRFSLSPQTKKVMDQIGDEITITCFYGDTSEEKNRVKDLLSAYRDLNGLLRYRFVNPDREPITARRYEVNTFGITIVESGRSREKLYSITESALTNAVYRVIKKTKTRICFTTGHGEKSIQDNGEEGYRILAEKMISENYSPTAVSILEDKSIPKDCSVLIVAGPRREILASEKGAITRYLENGGSGLFLIDPINPAANLADILIKYGISIEDDVIVDRSGVLTAGNYLTPVVNRYGEHPVTKNFKYFSFFPQARSVSRVDTSEAASAVRIICYTNKNAYAETDLELVLEGKTRFDGGADKKGPIPLAAAYSSELKDYPILNSGGHNSTRIAVFGDSDFAANKVIDLYGNEDLIMNTINWLSMEEDLISIRPKSDLVQPVLLTRAQGRLVFWLSTIVMPVIVVIIGVVRLSRKKRTSEGLQVR